MESTTFHLEDHPIVGERLPDMSTRTSTGELAFIPGHVMPHPARDDLGGCGSYSSALDYIKTLASILRNNGNYYRRKL